MTVNIPYLLHSLGLAVQGRLCSDSGALQSNLKCCHDCQDQSRNMRVEKEMRDQEDEKVEAEGEEDMEIVQYRRKSPSMFHIKSYVIFPLWGSSTVQYKCGPLA